jgi:hypothetical protein
MIQLDRVVVTHADPEIVDPSPGIGLDLPIPDLHRDTPTPAREPAQPVLESHEKAVKNVPSFRYILLRARHFHR